jgi:hypothetical protein
MSDKQNADNARNLNKPGTAVDALSGPLQNLDVLELKVAELRAALKAGQPLSMGKTNLLSGIMKSLRYSMGSW